MKIISYKEKYINREISWLSFNARVLQEAGDETVPLVQRLRFLGIFSNNLDEFYRVRVASVRRMIGTGKKAKIELNAKPKKLLKEINKIVRSQQITFGKYYNAIKLGLEKENIEIVTEQDLSPAEEEFCANYGEKYLRPKIVPLMLNFMEDIPKLKELTIYLAVVLKGKATDDTMDLYALIEIPNEVERFIVLPTSTGKTRIVLSDDVVRNNLQTIFHQFQPETAEAYTIKVTRDAELDMDSDISKSLINKISESVEDRKHGEPVRFLYDKRIDKRLLNYLLNKLQLQDNENNIAGGKHHNFKDFMGFPSLGNDNLIYNSIKTLSHPDFKENQLLFNVLDKKDVLVHYPYQKFSYLLDLLREAAIDPNVSTIKMTMYRLAKVSSVANSLINAAKNGKKVIAVVELQARFDEEANIYWAKKMQEEGVKVIYGVPGLKVHAKLCLITRHINNKRTRYAHFSTGNFNENTAEVYADMSLFTSNDVLTYECNKVFQFFEKNYKVYDYKHLMISPHGNRVGFEKLIEEQIEEAKKGKPAQIFAKMNSLVDTQVIDKLYEASNCGVKIRLIVRGICTLIPQQEGFSENIEVISIVDKFLEHSRIFLFGYEKKQKIFLSSADWMKRNLDHRVEVTFPVYDKNIRQEILDYMEMQWADNVKARYNSGDKANTYRKLNSKTKVQSQIEWYNYLKKKVNG